MEGVLPSDNHIPYGYRCCLLGMVFLPIWPIMGYKFCLIIMKTGMMVLWTIDLGRQSYPAWPEIMLVIISCKKMGFRLQNEHRVLRLG